MMIRRCWNIAVLAAMILGMMSLIGAQQLSHDGTGKAWSNAPSSPLKFSEEDGFLYLDASSSVAPISRYRLGCIEPESEKVKLRSRERYSVEVNQAQQVMKRWALPRFQHGGINIHKCRGREKFAIIEVEFTDGALWKISVR